MDVYFKIQLNEKDKARNLLGTRSTMLLATRYDFNIII